MRRNKSRNRVPALIAAIMLCVAPLSAQTIQKHIVQRGETLATIAEKYGVSKDELAKLNPDAAQFVYVGMELNIPGKAAQTTVTDATAETGDATMTARNAGKTSASFTGTQTTTADKSAEDLHKLGDVEFLGEFTAAYHKFNGDGGKAYSGGILFKVAFGPKVWLSETVYATGRLGYRGMFNYIKKNAGDGSLTTHSIYLPLYVGAKINKFFIEAGPYFDYIVSGKVELGSGSNKTKSKIKDDKFSTGLSMNVGYKEWCLSLGLGLTDYAGAKKCKEFFVGLGLSF